jgi:hypothetical protein
MSTPIPNISDWRLFEDYARRYFSDLWSVELAAHSVGVAGRVPRKFDLVSPDGRLVGDDLGLLAGLFA